MGNGTVLEFPKDQSIRKRLQDKAQEQKAVLILSIASVLLMTVFLNQWLVDSDYAVSGARGNRQVASFEPAVFARDVKWEHDLAQKLSQDESALAISLGEKPTLRDDLIFGYLEGKYGMKVNQGRIERLEFIDAQAGEEPMAISDKAQFLTKYSGAFGMRFNEASLVNTSGGEQVFSLVNSAKSIIGQAHFAVDDQGRVHSIVFTQ